MLKLLTFTLLVSVLALILRSITSSVPLFPTTSPGLYSNASARFSRFLTSLQCEPVSDAADICTPDHCSGVPQRPLLTPSHYRARNLSATLTMAVYPVGELISDDIVKNGKPYCPDRIMGSLQEAAREGRVLRFLDIGSNIGSCALLAASLGHEAISVEPMSSNVRLIEMSARLSSFPATGRLTILPVAAAAKKELQVLLKEKKNSGNNIVMRSADVDMKRFGSFGGDAEYETPEIICSVPLDILLHIRPDLFRPDLIKLDVQGHEPEALQGMRSVLKQRTARLLVTEVWPMLLRKKGTDLDALFTIAAEAGYQIEGVPSLEVWRSRCEPDNAFDVLIGRI
jgi:FkbM family methyltransferase